MKTLESFVKDHLSGADIVGIRKLLGKISQDKFAKYIGVTTATVGNWETNRVAISPESQFKVLSFISGFITDGERELAN